MVANTTDKQVCIPPHTNIAMALEAHQKDEVMVVEEEGRMEVAVYGVILDETEIVAGQAARDEPTPANESVKGPEDFILLDGSKITLPPGISLQGMDTEQANKIALLLKDNMEAFSVGDFDLGCCDSIPHIIKVSDDTPIRLPYRRISPTQVAEVKTLLNDMLAKNIIRKSSSPYASPIVLVKKKSGTLRLCIDYRQLNAVTVKDSFPLPRIEETLEALGGAKYFSTLDLSHGYFQVAMEESSIDKTAFRVPWGLYEFTRMPQGLCNSPSTFQRIMEHIFGDMNMTQLILYLDDILVFSTDIDSHLQRLDTVFKRLAQNGLKLKGEKCKLFKPEVTHLGQWLTRVE
ncbi:putative transposon Ty3-I Gag-Pol polyprotein [Apostichopus japonicus]|uniref:Putative transposon Ty3-I Gag-Pol polyprotein n=1 Tax=Stichopus japonicus TaxID=307972 RepID=A0A2G8JZC6_STIJA|nr:putative transposon Ty3-I Gag-Pol polyprotein [Apostichopus japonicus]